MVTAFLLAAGAAAGALAATTPVHVLPTGTTLVFVSDGHLDADARDGSTAEVHLRDPLVLDGSVVAPAGTRARLIVGRTEVNGKRVASVTLQRFTIPAGLLPVRTREPITLPIASGASIDATMLAEIEHAGDRFSIRIPFPYPLSADKPASYYTPTPARTPPPRDLGPGRSRGRPSATPIPTASSAATPLSTTIPATRPTKAP